MKTTPAPRLKLDPSFKHLLRDKMRTGMRSFVLAHMAGFPHQTDFSEVLNAPRVAATPLVISRLDRLAKALGYSGALFATEEEAVQV